MSDKLRKILSVLLVLVIIACSYVIFDEYQNANKATADSKSIKETIAKNVNINANERFNGKSWKELKEQNKNFVGYLIIDDIIEEPVLQAKDNDYYLHHTFSDEYAYRAGAPFMDHRSLLTDDNIVIYGHNNSFIQDVTFSKLNDIILNQSFYEEHPTIQFYLENEVRTYNICYAYYLDEEGYQHYAFDQSTFFDYLDFSTFIDYAKTNSQIESINGDIYFGDKILTLQTCKRYNQDVKVIIVAKEAGKRYY